MSVIDAVWQCQECGNLVSNEQRAFSVIPDHCTRCQRDSIWTPHSSIKAAIAAELEGQADD
jgi:hypothetical protein